MRPRLLFAPRVVVALLLTTTSGCVGTSWTRQDGDVYNSATARTPSAAFQGTLASPTILGQVVEAVIPGYGTDKLYFTTRLNSFEIVNRANGSSKCHIALKSTPTAAPTMGSSVDAYAGGERGFVWRFALPFCAVSPGWPIQLEGSIVGPILVEGPMVYAATINGNVTAIDTTGVVPKPLWTRRLGSAATGSMACATIKSSDGYVTILLVSTTDSGLFILDAVTGTILKNVPTGALRAGPAVGLASDLNQVAVVGGYGSQIFGITLAAPFPIRWTRDVGPLSPGIPRFEAEASISTESAYLTTGNYLIGLSIDDGIFKWAPVNLQNSGGALRPASTNHGQVFVADGNFLKLFDGANGTLMAQTVPDVRQGELIVRPTIDGTGVVLTGDAEKIVQFH